MPFTVLVLVMISEEGGACLSRDLCSWNDWRVVVSSCLFPLRLKSLLYAGVCFHVSRLSHLICHVILLTILIGAIITPSIF